MTGRCLVLDAPAEVTATLAGTPGLEFVPEAAAGCAAVVRLCPLPPSPFHRQHLLSAARLDAIARAPVRYNIVILGDASPTAALVRYLARASAVTGQVLAASKAPTSSERTA